MLVSDLIVQESRGWDCDFIWQNFHCDDAEAILRVPLSYRFISDSVVWLGKNSSQYSVRSGYCEARNVCRGMDWTESSKGVMEDFGETKGAKQDKSFWLASLPQHSANTGKSVEETNY